MTFIKTKSKGELIIRPQRLTSVSNRLSCLPGLNATIKDRYFGAASATPASVFPRLIRLSQHHLGKLEGGKKVVADKRMQEIMGRLESFPSHLGLADQGLFAIGYYHQRQDFFTKKPKEPDLSI